MSRCRYCFGGYCQNEDVRAVQLRTKPGGKWDAEKTTAGLKCREYLRGHFKFIKPCVKGKPSD
jgi:hypothetical protein